MTPAIAFGRMAGVRPASCRAVVSLDLDCVGRWPGGKSMFPAFLVFVGAGLGGVLRHGVNVTSARLFGTSFPWGTLTVNVAGSLAMGLLAGYFAFRDGVNWTQHARLFLTTGVLGGFTTFSTFSLDVALLLERGDTGSAAVYALASLIVSVLALFAGLLLVRTLAG
jgi:CrcB protein